MQWSRRNICLPQYKYVSTNQHGDRFKRCGSKQVSVVTMATDCSSTKDMQTLILLSHHLNVPVHYDFDDPQNAHIEVVGREVL